MSTYVSDFTNEEYSKTAFIELLSKRIKRDLRNNIQLDLNRFYCVYDYGVLSEITIELLSWAFNKRLNLVVLPLDSILDGVELLNISYLEQYVSKRLNVFFENEDVRTLKHKSISILRTITFKELVQLKEIYDLEGDLKEDGSEFIEELNKKYSQTKSSLLKSFNHIGKIL